MKNIFSTTCSKTVLLLLPMILVFGFWVSTKADGGIILGCVAKDGLLYIIGQGSNVKNCAKNQTPLSWNIQGVKGDKGDKGDLGPAGPQGPQGEKGEPGKNGSNLHLFDANGQDLGILLSPYVTYLPDIKAFVTFRQNTASVTADIGHVLVYYPELACQGNPFAVHLNPMQVYKVEGSGKYIVRSSSINPSDSLLAKSHISDSPEGCSNNSEVPDGSSQVLVNFVTLPFSEPLIFPLEIQTR